MANDDRKQNAPGNDGVVAVTRAMAILDAFQTGEGALTLGELARRTGLHKTTVLRIARTMAAARYLVQLENRSWRLGPGAGWLGARYQTVFDQTACIEPVLRDLSRVTGESAAFYVREESSRTCLVRVEGSQAIRHHVRMGEILPLNRGSSGRVLLAFSGEPGEPYDGIRRAGYHETRGERDPQVASVAFPVFGINYRLIGCVAVSGPLDRFTPRARARHVQAVRKAASRLSYELGGGMMPPKLRGL
jgi:DNA-binding IclR family transcriptional regulator